MSGEWSNPIFGCFGDFRTCILTFFCPCFTFGKNVEAMGEGEECMIHGLLYAVGLMGMGPVVRYRLRQKKGIQGSLIMDTVMHTFCTCCALVQEARELHGGDLVDKAKQEINRQ